LEQLFFIKLIAGLRNSHIDQHICLL